MDKEETQEQKLILGVTGHRELQHPEEEIKKVFKEKLLELKPSLVNTGMALGFDMLVAECCVEAGIPFRAVLAFPAMHERWRALEQERFNNLIKQAKEVVSISPKFLNKYVYLKRDKWVVENSDEIVSYLDPKSVAGGTFFTVSYAKQQSNNKKVTNVCFE
jgi:uncharacterized phage-like protein YoqJ